MRYFVFIFLSLGCQVTSALELGGTVFDRVGKDFDIDPVLLYSIALAESAYSESQNGYISPYPYTLRTDKPFYGKTKAEAEKELKLTLTHTERVDIGLMQINYYWHKNRIKDPYALLEPETNVRVAAQILKEALRSSPNNLQRAVGRYHSYNENRAHRYGLMVLSIYQKLKALD